MAQPSIWRSFLASIRFLTILPCGESQQTFDPRRTVALFPIGGLFIGALLVLVDTVARLLWDPAGAAVVGVVALAIITGALHLDGLADTADGLYGRRSPEKALAIMKDSRIGSIGMVVVVCCLGVKWAGLAGIAEQRAAWLLLIPAFARGTVLFGVRLMPYGRSQDGTGHAFFQQPLQTQDFWGIGLLVILTALCTGWGLLWIITGIAVLMTSILTYYWHKMKCITGDMLGAMIEISEAGLFLIIAAVSGFA